MQKVFVLLPVHNRRKITEGFVRSLSEQTYNNCQLILIDDGSTDGTAEMVRSMVPSVVVLTGKGDWWWGGSLHQGYKWIKQHASDKNDIVLIANDDIQFGKDYLENAVAYITPTENTLLLSQAYSKQTGRLNDIGTVVNWKKMTFNLATDKNTVNCLSTRGLFLKVGTFLKVGGFYPVLLPHYTSDYEFTLRAAKKGCTLTSDESVTIVMDESTTGIHQVKEKSAKAYLKKIFSKRAAGNPLYMSNFVLLSCPMPYIPINLLRIWKGFVLNLLDHLKTDK